MDSDDIDAIDKQISHHESIVVTLKTKRNALMRVNRLPPELLSRIFSFHVPNPYRWPDGRYSRHRDLIYLTHVCSHWRAVAVSSPSLWTFVDILRPKWIEETLRRSKMAPLTICGDTTFILGVDFLSLPLQEMLRTRELHLKVDTEALQALKGKLTSAAPVLETLVLDVKSFAPPFSLQDPEERERQIPGPVFGNDAPKLRCFQISGCAMDWDSLKFATVVELALSDIPVNCRPSIVQVMGILSAMSHLESLVLGDAVGRDTVSTLSLPVDHVQLPRLSHLSLCGDYSACVSTFIRLGFPPDASLIIGCSHGSASEPHRSILMEGLKQHFLQDFSGAGSDDRYPIPLQKVRILSGRSTVEVSGWTTPDISDPVVSVAVPYRSGTSPGTQQAILDICNTLSLEDLRAAVITTEFDLAKDIWIQVLGQSPGIESVSLTGEGAVGFVDALGVEVSGHGPDAITASSSLGQGAFRSPASQGESASIRNEEASVAFFLPGLQGISLRRVDFLSASLTPQPGRVFSQMLLDCLTERRVRGTPIAEISITECSPVPDSYIDKLDLIVPDVFADGNRDEPEDGVDEEYYYDDYDFRHSPAVSDVNVEGYFDDWY